MTAQQDTARAAWAQMLAAGFAPGPIAGILGNAQAESGIIPDRWEGDRVGNIAGGYGLLQWTPSTKLTDWAKSQGLNPAALETQVSRILWEVKTGAQFYKPGTTFAEWVRSNISPEQAADDFVRYYERPAVVNSMTRQQFARQWFNFLQGTPAATSPGVTAPSTTSGKNADGSTRIAEDGIDGVQTWARAHEVFGIRDSKGRYPSSRTTAFTKAQQTFLNKNVRPQDIKNLTGLSALKVDGGYGTSSTKVNQFYLFNKYAQAVFHRPARIGDFDGIDGHDTNLLFQHALNASRAGSKRY